MHTSREAQREDIETDLLCEAIYRHYGIDFREYARTSLKRRVKRMMELEALQTISGLQEKILHDQATMERFLTNLSVNVTSMFRDPEMYAAFRQKVIPSLRTYPSLRIWHAGCASGEEVYSLAILLEEEGLLDKTKIYATDLNGAEIKKARAGIFPLNVMEEYSRNYRQSGGSLSFSRYYTARYEHAIFQTELQRNIIFAKHNLVSDGSFNEFNVIFCRNVMIYFNENLQNQVHDLIYNSLCRFGILILGSKESIQFTSHEDRYRELDPDNQILQRKA